MGRSSNDAAIRRGFRNLKKAQERICLEGMRKVAKAGLEYLVEAHDQHRHGMLHTQEVNTIAYAIGYNGKVVESGFHKGEKEDQLGRSDERAEELIAGTTGYVAVIFSDMQGWYKVDYEMDFFYYTIDRIKEHFHEFFKPIS